MYFLRKVKYSRKIIIIIYIFAKCFCFYKIKKVFKYFKELNFVIKNFVKCYLICFTLFRLFNCGTHITYNMGSIFNFIMKFYLSIYVCT
ncbi:hypothetical protein PUN28_008807 [Cardiocondyla obscurior]|uniref:Uncharacterized protein n=1 Tax=Cardiocondyla obscurior TaxID=286306 RepID=A0AAW2FRD9_9HYME